MKHYHDLVQKLVDEGILAEGVAVRANFLVREWLSVKVESFIKTDFITHDNLRIHFDLTPKESEGIHIQKHTKIDGIDGVGVPGRVTAQEKDFQEGYCKDCHYRKTLCPRFGCGKSAPTTTQGKEWCKCLAKGAYVCPTDVQLHFPFGEHTLFSGSEVKFCFVCGTPRPQKPTEKTLYAKFIDHLGVDGFGLVTGKEVTAQQIWNLSEIAKEHFEGKK